MEREKVMQQIMKTVSGMNDYGLEMVSRWTEGLDKKELLNVNTTPDRVLEILDAREQARRAEAARMEQENAEKQAREHEQFMKAMYERVRNRENRISSLEGRERVFWNKINKVRKMDLSRYSMYNWQDILIAELYDNNCIDASYSIFCYGFYQGMQYMKNQARKQKQIQDRTGE